MEFGRKTLSVFLTRITSFVFSFATSILIARILGPEGKGALALIFLVPSLLFVIGNFGLAEASIYYLGRREASLEKIASNNTFLSLIISAILMAVFFMTFSEIHRIFFHDILPEYFYIGVVILPLLLFISYASSILLSQGKIRQFNLVNLIPVLVFPALFGFSLIFSIERLMSAVATQVLSVATGMIFVLVFLRRLTRFRIIYCPELTKQQFGFGLKSYWANLMAFLNYRIDLFLVAYFLPVREVGYYTLAFGLAEIIWYIADSVSTVFFPKISSLSPAQANLFAPVVCRQTLFLTGLAGLGLLAAGKPIIAVIYGKTFLPALLPLMILLPGVWLLSLGKVISNYLSGQGRPEIAAVSASIVLFFNIVLNIILIPKLGIKGAALVSTISYALATLIVLVAFLKISGKKVREVLLICREDIKIYRTVFSGKSEDVVSE